MTPPTVYTPVVGPGDTYRTDRLHVKTNELSQANGYPTTDQMGDDSTVYTEVTGP